MKTIRFYMMLASLTAMPGALAPMMAQSHTDALQQIRVGQTRSGQQAGVDMTVNLDALTLKSGQRLILRPVLCNEQDTAQFTPIVINGRKAAITYQRNGGEEVEGAQVINANSDSRQVAYRSRVPYKDWMDNARFYVVEDKCGCGLTKAGNLQDADALATLKRRTERVIERQAPADTLHHTNERSLSGSAFVHFPVNQTVILPNHHQNQTELGKILHTIDQVKGDPDFRIDQVIIHGYASPEGTYASNAALAKGRAEALTRYVADASGLPLSQFVSESTPEDWDGLVAHLKENPTPHAAEILDLINTETDPDRRDYLIRTRYPQDYATLLKDVYPLLRHSDYTVRYTVVSHTSETVASKDTIKETVVENADADVLDD